MEISEHFKLEGQVYDLDGLSVYCQNALNNQELPEWKRELFLFFQQLLDPSQPSITQYTSGTTGDPGKYILDRYSMVNSARKTLDFFNLKPGDRALLCLPIRYIAGKLMVVRALVGGLDLIISEPSGRPLKGIREPLTFAAMVPLQVQESLVHGDLLSGISILLIGGGELQHTLKNALVKLEQPAFFESFGMTETYTHFALKRINGANPDQGFRLMDGVSVSLDPRNCLVVEVQGVTSGPVTTSDLVEIDPSGTLFQWLGRYDNVINTGGIKVIPELLEEKIREIIHQDCLILPEADERLGNRLVLLVESSMEPPPLDIWLSEMKAHLTQYEVPKRMVTVKEIPRNRSMKMDRISARELLAGR